MKYLLHEFSFQGYWMRIENAYYLAFANNTDYK